MEKKEIYLRILELVSEYNKRNPGYFYPSSILRAKMGMSLEEIRPFAEELEMNGYIRKNEGFSPTFQISIREKGKIALFERQVDIAKSGELHIPIKMEILKVLNKESQYGKSIFVSEKTLLDTLHESRDNLSIATDEMKYYNLAEKIGGICSNYLIRITPNGERYLKSRA